MSCKEKTLERNSKSLGELHQRLGPDMGAWTWGRLHHALFVPAVASLADAETRAQMTAGPLETPGAASSPGRSSGRKASGCVP